MPTRKDQNVYKELGGEPEQRSVTLAITVGHIFVVKGLRLPPFLTLLTDLVDITIVSLFCASQAL